MKMSRGMMSVMMLAGTIGSVDAMEVALENDSAARRKAMAPDEPPRYGPGTGKVPEGFGPTERDKEKMAAAEDRRARRRARNLRNA